ncbi:MAG: BrxA family protein [Pirellulaceae bacterium]|nr:BrxA family protein [Pirellulaceae bacterium]
MNATYPISSFLAIKGPFIEATYRAMNAWDATKSPSENYANIERQNSIGAPSSGWLTQFLKATKRRYDFSGSDRPLVELVRQGWNLDEWRPVLLWHISQTEALLRSFIAEWLYSQKQSGVVLITAESVEPFIRSEIEKHLGSSAKWSTETVKRVASGLLKTAVEFHLMRGRASKEFESYRLSEKTLVYLLHVFLERDQSTKQVVEAIDWRIFHMTSTSVEEELLRLHQYGKLRFERAGSFLELTLPHPTMADYMRSGAL